MFDVTIAVTNPNLLADYQTMCAHAFDYTADVVGVAIAPVLPALATQLQREPGAVSYPVQWTSEKQRRAFFATKGFGKGIPYRRTHQLAQGYRVIYQRVGNSLTQLTVENDAAALRYVKGADQQRMHIATGWDNDFATYMQFQQRLVDAVFPALVAAWQPGAIAKVVSKYA